MMRKIDIDEDVWGFLKKNAEPFEDTPNSVLKRLLFANLATTRGSQTISTSKDELHSLPAGVPVALQQILEVTYLVKKQGYNRSEATNLVAEKRGIAPQTVIDKYCRQLNNKKAYEIDRLLEQNNSEFKSLVKRIFLKHHSVIDDFFETLQEY